MCSGASNVTVKAIVMVVVVRLFEMSLPPQACKDPVLESTAVVGMLSASVCG